MEPANSRFLFWTELGFEIRFEPNNQHQLETLGLLCAFHKNSTPEPRYGSTIMQG
jgi:hypothetical protein